MIASIKSLGIRPEMFALGAGFATSFIEFIVQVISSLQP